MERPSKPESVPYIVFEGEMARQERHVKRLWIALLAAITALALTVGIFVWYLNQYDFTSYEQDGKGVNIIGDGNGVDYNGTTSADETQERQIDRAGLGDQTQFIGER
jgi:hypothetical protein